tara:strand:+ start:360 stop:710 length:351 start_codon:yes stop_codon:yes gene_type:complete
MLGPFTDLLIGQSNPKIGGHRREITGTHGQAEVAGSQFIHEGIQEVITTNHIPDVQVRKVALDRLHYEVPADTWTRRLTRRIDVGYEQDVNPFKGRSERRPEGLSSTETVWLKDGH